MDALLPTTEGEIPTLAALETAQVRIEFRETTGFVELPVAEYVFGIAEAGSAEAGSAEPGSAEPGSAEPVLEFPATPEADAIPTVVA